MSFFGTKLSELLKRNHLSQSDLARQTGLSASHIGNLVNAGNEKWVSIEDLSNIALNITHEPHERAELVRAHLLDECQGPGSELVDISIRGHETTLALYDRPGSPPLSPRMERNLELVRQHADDPAVRSIMDGFGDLLEDNSRAGAEQTFAANLRAGESGSRSARTLSEAGVHAAPLATPGAALPIETIMPAGPVPAGGHKRGSKPKSSKKLLGSSPTNT